MNKYECIVLCVVSVSLAIVFSTMAFVMSLTRSIDRFTESLSQATSTSTVDMNKLSVVLPDGTAVLEVDEPHLTMNSRWLDVFMGIAMSESAR